MTGIADQIEFEKDSHPIDPGIFKLAWEQKCNGQKSKWLWVKYQVCRVLGHRWSFWIRQEVSHGIMQARYCDRCFTYQRRMM